MEAIILAGGFGTRLSTVVSDVPKPMAPINGRPFLEYLLEDLNEKGINRVILAVGYKKEIIKSHFKEKYKNIDIVYSDEDIPLGTGGAIKKALTLAEDENIFIINGDTFFDINLKEMYQFHKKNSSKLTLAIKEMEKFDRYGSLILEGDKIIKFEEKKYVDKGYINGGIYLINKKLLKKEEESFSFEKEILENEKFMIEKYGYKSEGYFIDIGVPEDYKLFNKICSSKISIIIPTYNRAHLLEKTIPTYLNQSKVEVHELIIIDDCSTDNTKEVIEKLMKNNLKIKYFRMKKNSRQQAAKNKGIELLDEKCNYVYFGDDDSILVNNSLFYLTKTLEEKKADVVGARALYMQKEEDLYLIDDFIKKNNKLKVENVVNLNKLKADFRLKLEQPVEVPILPACMLLKKELLKKFKFSEIYKGNAYREETDFSLELYKNCKKLYFESKAIQINYPRNLAYGGAHKEGLKGKIYRLFWSIKNNNIFIDKHYEFLKKSKIIEHKKIYYKYIFIYDEIRKIFNNQLKKLKYKKREKEKVKNYFV